MSKEKLSDIERIIRLLGLINDAVLPVSALSVATGALLSLTVPVSIPFLGGGVASIIWVRN